ncbi:MAG: hypothetical protein OEZ16_11500, partial [Chromatiales bacterium]|nr:hypothetical protein [Chromatiales bacterium]
MVNKERHLPSKVSEPHVGEHVEREALFSYLDDYVGRRVVWVAAPGGAGKTTLVGSYLASRAIETLWYEVDCRDTDPANIFHYLGLLACKAKLPSLTPEYQGSLPLFSASYFEQLFATLDKPFALVFDNLQEAPDEAALYTVLAMAARQLPAHGKIICISRNSPHRSFAEFQTKKQLLLIDESMMRLELEE